MAQLILIVDLEFLGCFGVLVDLANRCFILTLVFVLGIVVVIVGPGAWMLGEDHSLKSAGRGCLRVCSRHVSSLVTGGKSFRRRWRIRHADFRVCQRTTPAAVRISEAGENPG